MRIKEQIKRDGIFWLPSSPERQVAGTLTISDGGNIKLELTESLDPDVQAQLGYTHPNSLNPILGHVENDGSVMISQCYPIEKKRSIAPGPLIIPKVIGADRILTRLSYDENPNLLFNTFTFSVEGLDEWVDITGIEVDEQIENESLTISYNRPADILLNIHKDMELLITFAWTPPGFPRTKRAEVRQKTFFKLISKDPCVLDDLISVAQKITAFLCFVMDEIVCLDSMSATSDSYRQEIADGRTAPIKIYCRSWPYAKDEPKINDDDILFKYKDRQTRAESIINKWIDNYEQITPALDLYFLTRARTLPSLDLQFLTLVQALEAFHRRTSGENLSLGNRLERMTDPFDNFMCSENRPKLINKIVKTRNYLTHYNIKLEPEAAKGIALQFLCLKMNALFRLQFLKFIGFDEQEIADIVDKCTYLNGECKLDPYQPDEQNNERNTP